MHTGSVLYVVAAILVRPDGRFLIARKISGKPMAGLWEFPGGKINEGEQAEQAISREIQEELSLEITTCRLFCTYSYQKTDRTLHFTFFTCKFKEKEVALTDHDAIAWITPGELIAYEIAPADQIAADMILQSPEGLADNQT